MRKVFHNKLDIIQKGMVRWITTRSPWSHLPACTQLSPGHFKKRAFFHGSNHLENYMWVGVRAWVGPQGWLWCVCQEVISGPGTWTSNCFKSQLLRPGRNLSGSPMARPMQSSPWGVAQSFRADSSPLPRRSHYPISHGHLLCPQNFNSLSRRPRQRSAAP